MGGDSSMMFLCLESLCPSSGTRSCHSVAETGQMQQLSGGNKEIILGDLQRSSGQGMCC